MILHIASDAPLLVKAAAGAALVLHIGGGSLGIVSGFVAMAAPKGRPLHRLSGQVFFVSMLCMAAVGAVVSPMLDDRISGVMGLFTFYLVATGWMAGRRAPGTVGRFEPLALAGAAATATFYLALGLRGALSGHPDSEGQPFQLAFAFGAVTILAAVLDYRVISAGGVSGPARTARHLWRVSLALFIAAGSFFLGQQKVMPHAIQGSPLLMIPTLAPLVLLVFWMIKVRWPQRAHRAPATLQPAPQLK